MCSKIGVDPLASSKGFWAQLLGVGDFYYELGVQIVEVTLILFEFFLFSNYNYSNLPFSPFLGLSCDAAHEWWTHHGRRALLVAGEEQWKNEKRRSG